MIWHEAAFTNKNHTSTETYVCIHNIHAMYVYIHIHIYIYTLNLSIPLSFPFNRSIYIDLLHSLTSYGPFPGRDTSIEMLKSSTWSTCTWHMRQDQLNLKTVHAMKCKKQMLNEAVDCEDTVDHSA